MKKTLNLIVFTGWPADGKTTLSKRLSLDGFIRISTDELRKDLYPQDYDNLPYPEGWHPIWDEVCERRNRALVDFKDVIIDSCAHTSSIRDRFLDLGSIKRELFSKDKSVTRYLIQLIITPEERMRRFQKDDTVEGGNFSIKRMSSEFQSLIDYRGEGVKLLQLPNNNEEDQDRCYDLLQLLTL